MPLVKRTVEPVHVSRMVIDSTVRNELESVTNSTLSNIVRQLGSLSSHAEDLFNELHRETCFVLSRSAQLSQRVDRLKVKITQLNPTVEEVSLQEINMRKPFKSSVIQDQQVTALESRPKAIMECYNKCDAPPALSKLNPYREDGKDSMKFYTDPNYFFELWCSEMSKEADTQKHRNKHRNRKLRASTQPKTIRIPKNHLEDLSRLRHGPELAEPTSAEVISSQTPAVSRLSSNEYNPMFTSGPVMGSKKEGQSPSYVDSSGYLQTSVNRGRGVSVYQPPASSRYSDMSLLSRPLVAPPAPPPGSSVNNQSLAMNVNSNYELSYTESPIRVVNSSSSVMTPRDSLPPPPPVPSQSSTDDMIGRLYQFSSPPAGSYINTSLLSDADLPIVPPPPASPTLPSPPPLPLQSPLPPPPSEYDESTNFNFNSPSRVTVIPSPPSPASPLSRQSVTASLPPAPPSVSAPPPLTAPPPPPINDMKQSLSASNKAVTSLKSSASIKTSFSAGKSEQPAMVRDNRCDLLAAIRQGFQLRKVEENRQKSEKKQQTSTGRLMDVQTIMEAAFERRRRAIEENDSDDDDNDNTWDDDD